MECLGLNGAGRPRQPAGVTTISVTAETGGFAITNLPTGVAAGLSIDSSQLDPPVVITLQGQSLLQNVAVAAGAASVPVTIGDNLGTITITPGETAAALQAALITAIDAANLVVSPTGVPVGPNDVQVSLAGTTYSVLYQGLLNGSVGDQFFLSVPPVATVSVPSSTSDDLSSNAVGGTYTILTPDGSTAELAWNASASAVQSARQPARLQHHCGYRTDRRVCHHQPAARHRRQPRARLQPAPAAGGDRGPGTGHRIQQRHHAQPRPRPARQRGERTGHDGRHQHLRPRRQRAVLRLVRWPTKSSRPPSRRLLAGQPGRHPGQLNLAAGNGVHKLYISNEGSV